MGREYGSVSEVRELEGETEVAVLELGDDRLEVITLLALHPQLIALRRRLHALHAESLDELVELLGISDRSYSPLPILSNSVSR